MVNRAGQSTTEYILMLSVLTIIGIWIMKAMIGNSSGQGGAVNTASKTAADKIAND